MPASSLVTRSEGETVALGRKLAVEFAGGGVLLLEGDMGTGKTVLVRGLAGGLGLAETVVQSPTFTLINEYRGTDGSLVLVHCDLYRLDSDEIEGTGLFEYFDSVTPLVVEWSDRLPVAPFGAVTLRLSRVDDGESTRRIERWNDDRVGVED